MITEQGGRYGPICTITALCTGCFGLSIHLGLATLGKNGEMLLLLAWQVPNLDIFLGSGTESDELFLTFSIGVLTDCYRTDNGMLKPRDRTIPPMSLTQNTVVPRYVVCIYDHLLIPILHVNLADI